jgi:uncharacterized membrane protein YkoI
MTRAMRAIVMFGAFSLTSICWADSKEHEEEHLKLEQLPAAVQQTVKKESATVKEIEKETEDGQSFYEVKFQKGSDTYALHIADNGKVLKREKGEED